jgi:hypothetical protein
MVSSETAKTLARASASSCIPAPAAIKPSAMDAAPMRDNDGSNQYGMENPLRLATKADAVARISGLRNISRIRLRLAWRTIGHTAPTLNSGTHTPINTAINCTPCDPARRSAMANPMKELKRNATCALLAWSRALIQRFNNGTWGSIYASVMPVRPNVHPAPINREAACTSSGLLTMD